MRPRSCKQTGCWLLLLVLAAGCRSCAPPWSEPVLAPAALSPATREWLAHAHSKPDGGSDQAIEQVRLSWNHDNRRQQAFRLAELHYAAGATAAAARSETCVDHFYQAAGCAFLYLVDSDPTAAAPDAERMRQLYNSSLARLIQDGQAWGRLDAKKQISVHTADGPRQISLVMQEGPWKLDDIDQLVVVGDYKPADFTNRYGQPGLGVALVAVRRQRNDGSMRDRFLFPEHPFAVTAILHPDLKSLLGPAATESASFPLHLRLELHDPNQGLSLQLAGKTVPLAADLSAPFQFCFEETRPEQFDIIGFRHPSAKNAGLFLLEPYQPGKIPIVFVHGLLSDPHTWDEMLNELRTDPVIRAHCQFAVFMYTTGNPFLLSADNLRQKLQEFQQLSNPAHPDPALQQTILVGHSMGGLLARFQVTRSENLVWNLFSQRPFQTLRAPPATENMLRSALFFEPQPYIKRVVFIATPHRGSTLAKSLLGRIGNCLVNPPREIVQTRDQLLAENPGAFNPAFARSLPTSVADLASGSPILTVMQKLPFGSQVHLHSIIGHGELFPLFQPGDGYVPITSAHLDGVESELFVKSGHMVVHKQPQSIREVQRIIHQHLRELGESIR